jgi:hypothetical protein
MIFPMKTFPIAALGLMLTAWPALAEPQVEAGDPLSPCTADSKAAKSNDVPADQSGAQWGVEVASSFDKQKSLDAFAEAKDKYSDILGDYSPTIVEVCDLSMGTDLRYSARIDLDKRDAADKLCDKLQAAGGACVVLKN